MRFGIFYEHQLPRPWDAGRNDQVLMQEALEQVASAGSAPTMSASRVMPQFKEREAARDARKMEELAPYIERAFSRKREVEPSHKTDAEPQAVASYGKPVAEGGRGIGAANKIF